MFCLVAEYNRCMTCKMNHFFSGTRCKTQASPVVFGILNNSMSALLKPSVTIQSQRPCGPVRLTESEPFHVLASPGSTNGLPRASLE